MKALLLFALSPALWAGGELRFSLHQDPKTLHPALASEVSSATLNYLTGGVLIRINRLTQRADPELAQSWKLSRDGRTVVFQLRKEITFSDGTPFTADDVAFTLRTVTDPGLHSPFCEPFTGATASVTAPDSVSISFPHPLVGWEKSFDQLVILSARSPLKEKAALGPFFLSRYQPGVEILLARNSHYWKPGLPRVDAVRISFQANREIEFTRFRRGELHLINQVEPEQYDRLLRESPTEARDSGPSTDVDFLWFNLVPSAPLPEWKKVWFRSRTFRSALSQAINREDIIRVAYRGHGSPALGPFSPANKFWFNARLAPQPFSPAGAIKLLESEGFHRVNNVLMDSASHPVEFSLVTNAGNKARERTAALIQQDLSQIGIKLNIVTLDFRSLVERITRSFQYESCLLGLTNVDLDPNDQMNIWLSSSDAHGWNPSQKTPATPWEARIDDLMRRQAALPDRAKRKALFDQVQQILREEVPYLFLVHRNSLSAVSTALENHKPAALFPQTFWDAEHLALK